MKKILIALAFASISFSYAKAQDLEVSNKKFSVATNSFWANWFVSAGISANSSYASQETNVNGNPFCANRSTLGGNLFIGKWFTPSIGLRTAVVFSKLKQVNSNNDHPTYKALNIHEDVLFNLSNMLVGYNEYRVWNFIPYVGMGLIRNTSSQINNISYHAGLLNNFRINKHVQAFFDVYSAFSEGSTDGAAIDSWAAYEKSNIRHWDKYIGVTLGVTYNLGKSNWDKTPNIDALMAMNKEQMDALNQSLLETQDENARLREMLEQQETQHPANYQKKEIVSTSVSVFFDINSDRIASRKDLVNVKELAEYAKANNFKVLVIGYADSKTGSTSYNQDLSQRRADVVTKELVKMGVNRNDIITEAQGGVDSLSPFSYNRRVTVKLQ